MLGGDVIRQNRPIDPNPQLFVWRHMYRAGISQKFPPCSMSDPLYMGSEVQEGVYPRNGLKNQNIRVFYVVQSEKIVFYP